VSHCILSDRSVAGTWKLILVRPGTCCRGVVSIHVPSTVTSRSRDNALRPMLARLVDRAGSSGARAGSVDKTRWEEPRDAVGEERS
jgi:hypothetical protein